MDAFFSEAARERVRAAVEKVEAASAVEVVVTARRFSGDYLAADQRFGFGLAVLTLGLLLFLPTPFALPAFIVDVVLVFLVGTWLARYLGPVRRALAGERRLAESVARAARAAFFDMGVSGTRDRTGVLVYVAAFERRVELLLDSGIDPAVLPAAWAELPRRLEEAVRRDDVDAFVAALEGCAAIFGPSLPRRANDVNELPDTMEVS